MVLKRVYFCHADKKIYFHFFFFSIIVPFSLRKKKGNERLGLVLVENETYWRVYMQNPQYWFVAWESGTTSISVAHPSPT